MALLVVDGLERREETVEVAQLGAGLAVGQPHRLRTAVPAPEALARGSKLLLQKFAAAIGRGAVTLQRQIELQDLRAKGMRFGLLLPLGRRRSDRRRACSGRRKCRKGWACKGRNLAGQTKTRRV